jgi:O-antigen ligase
MALPSLAGTRERISEAPRSQLTRAAELLTAYGPAAIILTLPLEFTARYMGQPLARWIMVLVAASLAYLLVTGRRKLVLPRQRSTIWLAAFVAVSIVSWLLTRAPSSYKAFADVALYPFFGLMVMNLVVDEHDHRRAWIAFLVSGLVVALLGFGLYVSHHTIWTPNPAVMNRLNITFADPNVTARFLTIAAAAAVVLFATRRAPAWLCLATACACAVVIPMTYSRSGLALFIFSIVIAAAVTPERKRSVALALALLAVFAFSTVINPVTRLRAVDAENTFASLVGISAMHVSTPSSGSSDAGDTVFADNRRYLVEAGIRMFRDHPLLGVGYGAFQHELSSTYKAMIPSNLAARDVASHTAFITIASEMGIAGLLLFLGFLFQLGREAFASRRNVWVLLPAMLILPLLLYAQFEGRLIEEPYLWLCLALAYAAIGVRDLPRMRSHTM